MRRDLVCFIGQGIESPETDKYTAEVIPSSKDAIRNLDDDWNVVTVEEAAGYKKGKKKRAAK